MKTVDIVKMSKGWHVTLRYCGMNKGAAFFPTIAPIGMKKTEAKKFLSDAEKAKENFIKNWMG